MYTTACHSCVYINCGNKQRKEKGLSFFRFPISDENRLNIWVENSGNPNLIDLTKEQLSSKILCEIHFKPEYIVSSSNLKSKRLVGNAVPNVYTIDTIAKSPEVVMKLPVTKVYSNSFALSETLPEIPVLEKVDEIQFLTPIKNKIRRKLEFSPNAAATRTLHHTSPTGKTSITENKLSSKLKKQTQLLSSRRVQNFRLKKKLLAKSSEIKNVLKNKSNDLQTFVNMQLHHKTRTPWTEDQKILALSYFYKSPSLYNFMREKSKMVLPSPRTIRNWLNFFHLRTGVETPLFLNLKYKVDVMEPMERQCVLIFDEMSIKKSLQLNMKLDLVEGFEDFGHLGRSPEVANHATVFMLRGLFTNWKIPISYYYSNGPMKGDKLVILIKENISKCVSLQLNIRCVIADQGANNRLAFSKLEVTKEHNFFKQGDRIIYALYDVPHLIKSIRNTLLSTDIFMYGKRVSWNDIRATYNVDNKKSTKARMLCKISDRHIYPNSFDKMSVKLAVQVFSKTMAAAIEVAIRTKSIYSNSGENTVEFISKMNNIFDCLNSRVLRDSNQFRCGLSDYNASVVKTLEEAIDFFENCKVYSKEGRERKNIYCFNGMLQTISAILKLFSEIKAENYKFLLTSRLQQDALENQFSVIRNRGGYNANPTARQFRQSLQQCMHIRILDTVGTGNCEQDNDEILDLTSQVAPEPELKSTIDEKESNESDVEEGDCDNAELEILSPNTSDTEMTEEMTQMEECAFVYFVEYLVFRCLKEFNCQTCEKTLQKPDDDLIDKNEIFLVLKDYGKPNEVEYLKRPSNSLLNVMHQTLDIFHKYFDHKKHIPNITKEIRAKTLNTANLEWLSESDECYEHRLFIFETFIKIKIHKHLLWETHKLKFKIRAQKRKLKIVQNQ